jgi:meso-butanediol dehydrogenase/(S,S)-butanediol dehydrogenase/diacetyl reductase
MGANEKPEGDDMLGSPDFRGKAVLVTGAASGLGRTTAKTLAERGAELCIVDVNEAALKEAAAEIEGLGGKVHPLALDLSQRANCAAAVDGAVERMGGLNALVNVAGVIRPSKFTELPSESYDLVMAVNLAAPFFLCQRAIPHLLERKGNIVNVASNAGFMGMAYMAVYAASKAALVSLTKSLAMEYAKTPLTVSAVAPAGMQTALMASVSFPPDADFSLVERYSGFRGLTSIEEVAEMIAVLASERGASYHGTCVLLDCGSTAG